MVKSGKPVEKLSSQQVMTCNYMNEGCDGGWPLQNGFLMENGYLVTEKCAPYKGKTKGDSCSNYAECPPHSKIQSSYFVGKGYGGVNEKNMMKEIMRNGMINGELMTPSVFGMYQTGILSANGIDKLHDKVLSLA